MLRGDLSAAVGAAWAAGQGVSPALCRLRLHATRYFS